MQGPSAEELNIILSVRVQRSVSGSSVKCESIYWAFYDENGRRVNIRDKAPCTVIKALDGTFYGEIDNKRYFLQPLAERLSSSSALGDDEDLSYKYLPKKPYIPAADHPWKRRI